jgi:Domain of unknown function (DUF4258)
VKVETIQEKIAQGRYIISFTHTEKLRQRRIKAEDIEQAIKTGTIIEDYPEDRRGPSCLILGFAGKRPLHVVCGRLDDDEILIITAYEPDPAEWESDGKTRKRR